MITRVICEYENTMIEVEHRARFDQATHDRLEEQLRLRAETVTEDDKDVVYYIYPDKLIKAVANISAGSCKLSFKSAKLGSSSAVHEKEVVIPSGQFQEVVEFCDLAFSDAPKRIHSPQKRTNYLVGGVDVSLKITPDWGPHLEMEIVVDKNEDVQVAEERIFALAKDLQVTLMTQEEIRDLQKEIEARA